MHKNHPLTPMTYTQLSHTNMKMLTHFFLFLALQINTALPLSWARFVWEDTVGTAPIFSFLGLWTYSSTLPAYPSRNHYPGNVLNIRTNVRAFPVIQMRIFATHCSSPVKPVERKFQEVSQYCLSSQQQHRSEDSILYSSLQSPCVRQSSMTSQKWLNHWYLQGRKVFGNERWTQARHSSFNSASKTEKVTN